ncbi:hypothetical protein DN051_40140 [Streptomyces cadmiisoli]|uniref:Uncharacterized protein n=1 Tax=Streptomyces cadmiisoli TaxID=2184053 RepID=A0A2Z4JCG3_9ACTN|nr:hypothetical protein DN051_00670 [Streptomyces cadmiisoli]AWW42053.1 hypothetical protein DN051_40140 [Streptomyces cadmiisoli]
MPSWPSASSFRSRPARRPTRQARRAIRRTTCPLGAGSWPRRRRRRSHGPVFGNALDTGPSAAPGRRRPPDAGASDDRCRSRRMDHHHGCRGI